MKLNRDLLPEDKYWVRAYDRDTVSVGQRVLRTSLVLTPERLIEDWPLRDFADLAEPHLRVILALTPEIVVLGSGTVLKWPPAATLQPLTEARIGVEVMDTGAACRAYNILMSEGRRVAAGLVLPG